MEHSKTTNTVIGSMVSSNTKNETASNDAKTKLYVAYGSNLNTTQMKFRCPTARIVGAGILHDYKLVFRGSNGNAVATIESSEGRHVSVLIWEVTAQDEAALDAYEGFPTFYRKETVMVHQRKWSPRIRILP